MSFNTEDDFALSSIARRWWLVIAFTKMGMGGAQSFVRE